MRPNKPLTRLLTIVSCAAVVASCETPGGPRPSVEDLRVTPKPVPSDEVLVSREAGEKHDNAVEAWGEAGWAMVARQCRFWRDQGMTLPFTCPPPPGGH